MVTRKLDELLLAEGLVDEQSLSLARTEALARQRKLAEIVIDLGLIDQRSLAVLLANESGVALVSPIDLASSKSLAETVPVHIARRHQLIPVKADAESLVVAMIDPFEPGIVELVESATGATVTRAVGVRSEVEMAVLEVYGVDDAGDQTIQIAPSLALDFNASYASPESEFSGVPDEWSTPADAPTGDAKREPDEGAPKPPDGERTAPSTAGRLSDTERIAHVERQLLSVSRALALIQSRLDTIDARLANLSARQGVLR